MKNLANRIVPVVILLAVGYWIASGIISDRRADAEKQELETEKREAEIKEQKLTAEKHLQIEKSIKDMIAKHNASTDWRKIFGGKDGFSNRVYSVEIQDALTETDARPIMFLAFVSDVVRESDDYYVHFYCFDTLYEIFFSILFTLHCTQDQVDEIMHNQRDLFESNYAVIAKISSARKKTFGVSGNEDGEVSATILNSNIFVATGRCLDLLFVGDYKPENSQGAKTFAPLPSLDP